MDSANCYRVLRRVIPAASQIGPDGAGLSVSKLAWSEIRW